MRSCTFGAMAMSAALCGPAAAECRLALALAFDVSRSVGIRDYAIQKQGVMAALEDPAVVAAFLRPRHARGLRALRVEPFGPADHGGRLGACAFARRPRRDTRDLIAGHERGGTAGTTALGAALRFGRGLMDRAPPCAEQVIDVSGDGQNNSGIDPAIVYADGFGDIRVNGLAIRSYERDVVAYYREQIIRGPGAFVEEADSFEDFPRAIRRKLIRELTERIIGQYRRRRADARHADGRLIRSAGRAPH